MTGSWKLIALWSWAASAFGLVLMGGAFAATDGPTHLLFGVLGGAVPVMDGPMRFAVGLMGAVTFGWGLTIRAVASVSHLLDADVARLLWRRIAMALGAWYLVDSAISVATGFGLNVLSNTVLLVAFLLILRRGGVLAASASASGAASARA